MNDSYSHQTSMLLEQFKPLRTVKRTFYPRNFGLSTEFIQAFQREYTRLAKLENRTGNILPKMVKAMQFHTPKVEDTVD